MPVAHQRLPALRYLIYFDSGFIQVYGFFRIFKAPAILIHVRWRDTHSDTERVQKMQKPCPAAIRQLAGMNDASFCGEVIVYLFLRPVVERAPALFSQPFVHQYSSDGLELVASAGVFAGWRMM